MGVSGLDEAMSTQTGAFIGSLDRQELSLMSGAGSLPSGSVNFSSVVPTPAPNNGLMGPGVSVTSVNQDNSSISQSNVTTSTRPLSRSGDGFTSLALQNYGLAVPF